MLKRNWEKWSFARCCLSVCLRSTAGPHTSPILCTYSFTVWYLSVEGATSMVVEYLEISQKDIIKDILGKIGDILQFSTTKIFLFWNSATLLKALLFCVNEIEIKHLKNMLYISILHETGGYMFHLSHQTFVYVCFS